MAAYLACGGLFVELTFAEGYFASVLAGVAVYKPYELEASQMAATTIGILVAIAVPALVAVWCCHADSAMRDAMDGWSRWVGPLVVLLCLIVSMTMAVAWTQTMVEVLDPPMRRWRTVVY